MALGLTLVLAQGELSASAAASSSLPTSWGELKEWVLSEPLRHGWPGFIVIVLIVALFQAQNVVAFIDLLVRLFRLLSKLFLRLQGRSAEKQPVAPAPNPAPKVRFHNLPPPRSGFVARDGELEQLTLELAPEAAQVVIHGMPGVGKTTLALRYAHTSRAEFPGGAWWLDASQGFEPMALAFVTELEARIPGLGSVEGLELAGRLRRCFEAWPGAETEAVLLVVDNLPPPGEGLAMVRSLKTGMPGRFRLLLTQRALALPAQGIGALKLPVLASDHALELFKKRSGETGPQRIAHEEGQAQALVEQVGRLPLALVLLGGRLQRVPTLTVTGLREDLSQSALAAQAFSDKHAAFLDEQGLVATLLSSWRTLGQEAMELARLLSLTLPAPIPWELIQHCKPPATGQLSSQGWDDALAELLGVNLLDSLAAERTLYALHPLVREFFALQRQGWEQEPQRRVDLSAAAKALATQWQGKELVIAVEYWRQACSADAADIWAAYGLGYGLLPFGDSDGAKQAFEICRRNAEAAKDEHGLYSAWIGIGDVLVAQGDGPAALEAYLAGLTIAESLAKHDSANTGWLRDLSVSHEKIGNVLVAQGDGSGALSAYQASLQIREDLAKRDPANTEWQLDLAGSHEKIGDVLKAQGDLPGALKAYKKALAIAADLTKRDPANTQWQRVLSVGHVSIGDVLMELGDSPGAMVAYQASLEIREALTKRDPANTEWQLDLSISQEKIGEVLEVQGDGPGALTAYQQSLEVREALTKLDPYNTEWQLALSDSQVCIGDILNVQGDGPGALTTYKASLEIREGLTKRDPANTEWQRDLSVSQVKIGYVLVVQGDGPGALAAYQAGLAIRESLAKRDPSNTRWQRDLSNSHDRIGDVLEVQGDGPGALAAYQAGLAIAEGLAKRDPANTEWQRDLSVFNNMIGEVLAAQGDGPGALAAYQAGLAIRQGLAKRDPANTGWQHDLAVSHMKIGNALKMLRYGPAALKSYQAGLAIAADLTKRDPANTEWQVGLTKLYFNLGTLENLLAPSTRRAHLQRGLDIQLRMKQAGRLHANEDTTASFEKEIQKLDTAPPIQWAGLKPP